MSVQFTQDDLFSDSIGEPSEAFWVEGNSSLTAETVDSTALVVVPAGFVGMRVILLSYSSGGECQLRATQAE